LRSTLTTAFFRTPDMWRALEAEVLPAMATTARPTVVWSAGCGTGEEAYTAAILLAESRPDAPRGQGQVIGTDLDPKWVARARLGVFADPAVGADRLERWFEPHPRGVRPVKRLRSMVRFKVGDLLRPETYPHPVGVVLLRNVLWHLQDPAAVLRRARSCLRPDGRLVLGGSDFRLPELPGRPVPADMFKLRTAPPGLLELFDEAEHPLVFAPRRAR